MKSDHSEYRTTVVQDRPDLRIERCQGDSKELRYLGISVAPKSHTLLVNVQGFFLVQTSDLAFDVVVSPQGLAYFRGPAHPVFCFGRGHHDMLIISWPEVETLALTRWVDRQLAQREGRQDGVFGIARPMSAQLQPAVDRLLHSVTHASKSSDILAFSAMHEMVGKMLTSAPEICITKFVHQATEPVKDLIASVKDNPTKSWTLVNAAKVAGYSQFHLSRSFKTMFGYGFPEYVDRCRTEMAITELIERDAPVDQVARTCGFGSGQALRTAMKEYIGILPSELRRLARGELNRHRPQM